MFFRSYYAISGHLRSPKGLPTNALYGFFSMTVKFLRESKPEYIVYCFDHEKPSFRSDIYSEYKANRSETPEDLKVQIPYVKKLTTALGIPMLEKAGYEADDIIGTLCAIGRKKKFKVVIMSGDKDFAQLVGDDVSLYDPMKDVFYDSSAVQKKWGITPGQMIDYLSLVGDSSDNIPGVLGIGPKGAMKLLSQYGNLENIYDTSQSEIPKATALKLQNSKEKAFLSQKLARIVTDIPIKISESFLKYENKKGEELKKLLQELGFKTFEEKIYERKNISKNTDKPKKSLPSNLKVHYLHIDEIREFVTAYRPVWIFTDSFEKYFLSHRNRIISLEDQDLSKMGQILSYKRVLWCGHDLKKIWKQFHCQHPLPGWCSLVAAYLIDSAPPGSFASICQKYSDISLDLVNSPGEIYQVHKKLKKSLQEKLQEQNLIDIYENMELPLISVLLEMEQKGVQLNTKELKNQSKEINRQISGLENEIFDYTKHEFNLSSPKQLSQVLFHELGLKPERKTKTGYSTDMDVLSKLKNRHPVVPLILKHRELFKLKTTYVEALPPLVRKETGRIHTHFRQTLTTTGRLSSVNPNLQNIPIRTKQGRLVRKAFVASDGFQFISADYSQIELRVLAHISEDKALCDAFEQDLDIHKATASEIYSIPVKEVSQELRHQAKAVNFGLIYGQGPYTLSESLGVTLAEGKEIITNYFKRFKMVREYMESTKQFAQKEGYVETLFGRRRPIKELSSSSGFQTKRMGERIAINTPIQGTASDLMKIVMIELRNSIYSSLLLQIHDELLFECKDSLVVEESQRIQHIMENFVSWKVPLKVNISVGKDWGTAHPF